MRSHSARVRDKKSACFWLSPSSATRSPGRSSTSNVSKPRAVDCLALAAGRHGGEPVRLGFSALIPCPRRATLVVMRLGSGRQPKLGVLTHSKPGSCHSRQKAVSRLSPASRFTAPLSPPMAPIGTARQLISADALAAIRRRARDGWSSLLPCLGCAVLARYRAQRGALVCPAASARGCARTSPPCARR